MMIYLCLWNEKLNINSIYHYLRRYTVFIKSSSKVTNNLSIDNLQILYVIRLSYKTFFVSKIRQRKKVLLIRTK